MERIPRKFPTHGVAHAAVRKLVQHADENGPRAGLADEVRAHEHDLPSTELVQLVTYPDALHVDTLGDDPAARAAYGRIADRWPYPFGSFFDDALWRASLIDERLGLYPLAIDDLERMLRQRETTSIVGSYERAKFVPAMMRIGERLSRDRLHDRARARAAFHRLYADFAHLDRCATARCGSKRRCWREDGDSERGLQPSLSGRSSSSSPTVATYRARSSNAEGSRGRESSVAPRDCHEYIERTTDRESVGAGGQGAGQGD